MPEITINESIDDAGEIVRTRLASDDGELAVLVRDDQFLLPRGALDAVMKRYGKPLAEDLDPRAVTERLDLGGERSLVRFRFMSRYDVIARDYLVLYSPGAEPLCELATAVTAALDHLARRFSAAE